MIGDDASIAPLAFVCAGAVFALVVPLVLARGVAGLSRDAAWDPGRALPDARNGAMIALVCAASLGLAVYTASHGLLAGTSVTLHPFRSLVALDPLATFAIAMLCTEVLLCLLLSIGYLPAIRIGNRGYYGLLMASTIGMTVVVGAVDLAVLFVGAELMTVPLQALAGIAQRRRASGEAALKLVLSNALASAVLLYGAVMLYGAAGGTSYAGIREALATGDVVALAGLALLVGGLLFKVAAFPFHAWAPDVLHGAPTVVTALISVAATTAAVVALMRVLGVALPDATDAAWAERLRVVLRVVAAATMLAGSVMAFTQTNAKRMLAHAGVAHVGVMLVGVTAASEEARAAVLFYLIAYALMSIGAYGVLTAMSYGGRDCETIDALAGLGNRHPALSAAMALFLMALAGVPGTAGFVAKFQILLAAANSGEIALLIGAAGSSVLLLASYLRVPVVMYMRAAPRLGAVAPGSADLVVIALCAGGVLYLGFAPDGDPFAVGVRAMDAALRAAALP